MYPCYEVFVHEHLLSTVPDYISDGTSDIETLPCGCGEITCIGLAGGPGWVWAGAADSITGTDAAA